MYGVSIPSTSVCPGGRMRRSVVLLCAALCAQGVLTSCTLEEERVDQERTIALGGDSNLVPLFVAAGLEYGVPPEILATLSYELTRLRSVGGEHRHDERLLPVGVMALGEDLELASELAASSVDAVTRDPLSNIRAAAALLAHHSESMNVAPETLSQWRPAVESYASARTATVVMRQIERGWRAADVDGKIIVCSARNTVRPQVDGVGVVQQGLGFPGAHWNSAHSSNYRVANRGSEEIEKVVIHTTQGGYSGAISWFKDPVANVSAHYVIRSSDGDVTHMVDEKDVGWHAGQENNRSVGIEHEGYIDQPEVWYTESMYQESAALTFWLTQQYDIPIDREHIIGHVEGAGANHTDPGDGWDWDHYMELVANNGQAEFDATFRSLNAPSSMHSGEVAIVEVKLENTGDSSWGINETRVGTQMPQDRESLFYVDGSWLSTSRPSGASAAGFSPGSVGTFRFEIQAPIVDASTRYSEKFQLVQNGEEWFGPVFSMDIDVLPQAQSVSTSSETLPLVLEPSEPAEPGFLTGGCSVHHDKSGGWPFLAGLFFLWRRRRS